MKAIQLVGMLVFVLACYGCQQESTSGEEEKTTDLNQFMQGTWQTTQISVAVNTAEGLDSFRVEQLTEQVWEVQFGMKPPIFYFQPDQKFRREHRSIADALVDSSRGMWNTFGDTLMLIEENATYQYTVKTGDGRVAWRTLVDWDEDGEVDDEYQSVHRLISIGVD